MNRYVFKFLSMCYVMTCWEPAQASDPDTEMSLSSRAIVEYNRRCRTEYTDKELLGFQFFDLGDGSFEFSARFPLEGFIAMTSIQKKSDVLSFDCGHPDL